MTIEEDDNKSSDERASAKSKWIKDFSPLSMDDYLDGDPVDNHGDASFTGVWHSAEKLLSYLEEKATELFPASVLELGAGTGWLGITMARNLQDSLTHHVLTDSTRTGAVQWTMQNVQAAQKQGILSGNRSSNQCPLMVLPMDWNNAQEIEHVAKLHSWSLIVGSDLIYSEDGAVALAKCMAQLLQLNPTARLLYAHTQGRIPQLDLLWQDQLRLQGLQCLILDSEPLWGERRSLIMEIRIGPSS